MESALPPPSSNNIHITRSAGDDGGGRMRDIDINQIPEDGGEDQVHQQWRTMNTNYSTMDLKNHQLDHDQGGGGGSSSTASHNWPCPPCKKLRLSKPQSQLLEDSFRLSPSLTPKHKEDLAMKLQLTPRQVEVWFQNRRARSKLRQTEMECEYLRMWFNSLTEQNRCLQKELDELRTSKVEPPNVLLADTTEPLPASTLYMCPRCRCIATSTPSAAKEPLDEGD